MFVKSPFARAAGLVAVVLLITAYTVAVGAQARAADRSERFWRALWFGHASSPHYDSLAALKAGSDVVVLGRIVRVEEGRIFGDPHPANPTPEEELVRYVTATVEIDRVLAGATVEPGVDTLNLELPMPRKDVLTEILGNKPDEPAVFFLFNAGLMAAAQGRPASVQQIERDYYALVAFGAVVRSLGGKATPIDAPELEFLHEFESETFDRFIERIQSTP
jgi:hypothetical protein